MHKKRAAPLPPARNSSKEKKENGKTNALLPEESSHENGGVPNGHHEEDSEPVEVEVTILMPDGTNKQLNFLASTALMDLRMQLCAKYKLAPSSYTVEPLKAVDGDVISYIPSNTIADLNCSVIKIKGTAKEAPKPVVHKLPEQTVRLTVKMSQSQKSVMRVNPHTPLSELFGQIASKSGANSSDGIELMHPNHPDVKLDRNKSLDDYKIREVFVLNNEVETLPADHKHSHWTDKKPSLKITSLFKRSKKHKQGETPMSVATAPNPNQTPASKHNVNNSNNSHQRTASGSSDKPSTNAPPICDANKSESHAAAPVPASRNKRKAPVAPIAPPRSGSTSIPAGTTSPTTEKHKKPAPKPPARRISSNTDTKPTKPPRSKSSDSVKSDDIAEKKKEKMEEKIEEVVQLQEEKAEEAFEVPDDTLQREMAKATEEIDFALEADEDVPILDVESDEEEVIDLTGQLYKENKKEEKMEEAEEHSSEPEVESEPVVQIDEESHIEELEEVNEEMEKEVIVIDKTELILEENLYAKDNQQKINEQNIKQQVIEEQIKTEVEVIAEKEVVKETLHIKDEVVLQQNELSADDIIHPKSHYDPNFGVHAPVDEFDFMSSEKPTEEDVGQLVQDEAEEEKETIVIPAENVQLPLPPPPVEEPPAPVAEQPKVVQNKEPPQTDVQEVQTMEVDETANTEREIEKMKLKIQRMREKKRQEEESKFEIITDKSTGTTKGQKTFTFIPKNRPKVYEDTTVAPVLGINISSSGELKSYVPTAEPAEVVEEERDFVEVPTSKLNQEPVKENKKSADEPERIVIDLKETEIHKVEQEVEKPKPTSPAATNQPAVAPPRQHHVVHTATSAAKSSLPSYYKRFLQHSKGKTNFVSSAASKTNEKDSNKLPQQNTPTSEPVKESKPAVSHPPTSPKPINRTALPVAQKSTPVDGASKPTPLPQTDKNKPTSPPPPISPKPLHLTTPTPKIIENASFGSLPPPPEEVKESARTDILQDLPPPPEELLSEDENEQNTVGSVEDAPPVPQSFFGATTARPFASTSFRPMSKSLKDGITIVEYEDLNNNPLTVGENSID